MQIVKFRLVLIAVLLGLSCNYNPYKETNKLYRKQAKQLTKNLRRTPLHDSLHTIAPWVGTTNFNLRKPNFVIIHHTAQNNCSQTLKTFTTTVSQVSAHYVICKEGAVYHMLNDYLRAWHGGIAKWGNVTDINSSSIGIELDNNGAEPFTELQIKSLLELLSTLKKAYNIPAANFIGHADVAPSRKVDPNMYFPWEQLAEHGFGLWYKDTINLQVPLYFNAVQALKIIGYDTRDSASAIRAFKLHFLKTTSPIFTEADKKVLYAVSSRYEKDYSE